ncbi:MAG TPA: type II secretion system F family protein [Methylomirabilota bacterium]|nr:type II secretion system F family protein [Methylomirabilota bacterium]
MATFEYKAISAAGKMLVGQMEAQSRAEVVQHLERVGYTPVSARETTAQPSKTWRERLTPEPGSEEITGFTMDLAMLLKGGVTLDEALLILSQMESKRWMARLIRTLHVELSGGKSFSQVLAMHPSLFPPIYVKMIEVAETAGRLEEALTGIARERQRNETLRRKFMSAITYPIFLMVAAIGVLCFMLLYIVPQFEQAIAGFRDRLDPSSLRVFEMSRFFRDNIDLIGGGVAVVLMLIVVLGRLGRGRSIWIAMGASIPGIRTVITYDLTLTFCRTLSILVSNGVDISTSLRLIRGVVRLPAAAGEIDKVIGDVRQGKRLSEALTRHPFLPGHVVQMLRVGEESGTLADSADRVGGFYETRLETSLGRVTAIIGPIMMVGVSLLIAWLIISVMSALLSINDLLL